MRRGIGLVTSTRVRPLLYFLLFLLYLFHNDLWFWHDDRILLALPIGLLYHVGFCVAAALMMWLLVAHAWREGTETGEDQP